MPRGSFIFDRPSDRMNRPVNPSLFLYATFALALLIGLGGCHENEPQSGVPIGSTFEREGTLDFLRGDTAVIKTIDIEIADTPESRTRGLMYRRSLSTDQGMLFIFPEASSEGFWMKNTYIPLDIIFVGPDSQVVSIARRTQIMSEETIEPKAPKQFVVEVPAGFVRKYGIDRSTRIQWTRTDSDENSFLDRIF